MIFRSQNKDFVVCFDDGWTMYADGNNVYISERNCTYLFGTYDNEAGAICALEIMYNAIGVENKIDAPSEKAARREMTNQCAIRILEKNFEEVRRSGFRQ